MKKSMILILALAVLLTTLTVGGAVLAQTSASYNLEWHVIGGGGQPAASTHYLVNSTAGQAAASRPYSFSNHYVVSGGYWYGGGLTLYWVHLPLVVRKSP